MAPIIFGPKMKNEYVFLLPSFPTTCEAPMKKPTNKPTPHIIYDKKTFCNAEHVYLYHVAANIDKDYADAHFTDNIKSMDDLRKLLTKQSYVTLKHKECAMRTKDALKKKYDERVSTFDHNQAMKAALLLKFNDKQARDMLISTFPDTLQYKSTTKTPYDLASILTEIRADLMPKPKKRVVHKKLKASTHK